MSTAATDTHGGTMEHPENAEHHPGWSTYWKVALVLTVITVFEVWIYYIPSFVATPWFIPVLLTLSAIKFAVVVLFYMHLKYDNRLYRALFTGPFTIAILAVVGLLFLFGKVAIRTSLLK
jgi:cytochrome c oxidase subunit 4